MKMEIVISFAQDGTNVETQQIMKQEKTVDHVLSKRLFLQVRYFQQVIKYRNLDNDILVIRFLNSLYFLIFQNPIKLP